MANVYIDKVDGASATQDIENGTSVTVLAVVDNVAGIDTGTLLQNAINEILDVVGPLGSQCEGIDAANYLAAITPESVAPGCVKLRLVYKGLPETSVELGTSLSSLDVNTDLDGNRIYTTYDYPSDYIFNEKLQGKTSEQGALLPLPVQDTLLVFKFPLLGTDDKTASRLLLEMCQQYVGMVNQDVWTSAPGAARTWLCESIRGCSRNKGLTYEVTASFHYKELTWDQTVFYVDPNTGKPPRNVIVDVGFKHIKLIREGTLPVMPPPSL